MRLKSIKLSGFKSFVDTTRVSFPRQMTCIVGPNGCGKSNIIDAVRWVLGESSAKNLRGENSTDVIFNGTEGNNVRNPASQASVELVFENTEGRINGSLANRTEVAIKRVVTRDGTSTYYLNGEKCRRKDVTDAFLGTGMGARSYSIIEQGMISKLIESKPKELRVFLEEAAGISKYKERRRETENRMKHTVDNLDRLGDVIHELTKNLDKLKRQASSAKRYQELKTLERELKSQLAALRFKIETDKAAELDSLISKKTTDLESFRKDSTSSDTALIKAKTERDEKFEEQEQVQKKVYLIQNDISKTEQNIQHQKSRQNQLNSEIDKAKGQLARSQQVLDEEREEIDVLTAEIEEFTPDLEELHELFEQAQAELTDTQEEYESALEQWDSLTKEVTAIEHSISQAKNSIDSDNRIIASSNSRIVDLNEDIQTVSQELSSERIDELNLVIEEIDLQIVDIYDEMDSGKKELDDLRQEQASHETTINEIRINEGSLNGKLESLMSLQAKAEQSTESLEGWVQQNNIELKPIISELSVQKGWEKALESAINFVGNPFIVDNIPSALPEAAISLIQRNSNEKRASSFATLVDGVTVPNIFNFIGLEESNDFLFVINQQGIISSQNWLAIFADENSSGYFDRKAEIEEIQKSLQALAIRLPSEEASLLHIQEQLASKAEQLNGLQSKLTQLNQEKTKNVTERDYISKSLSNAQAKLERLKLQLTNTKEEAEEATIRIEENQEKIELGEESLINKQELLPSLEDKKAKGHSSVEQLKAKSEKARNDLQEIKLKESSTTSKLQALKSALKKSTDQINGYKEDIETYALELEESHQPIEDMQDSLSIKLEELSETEDKLSIVRNGVEEFNEIISNLEAAQNESKNQETLLTEAINNLKLQTEKHRIHAQTHLESLGELNVSITDIDETLLVAENEQEWDDQLEKTSRSIKQLGAVNLAAIDEYEQQSERMNYLQQQSDDLNDALVTLEDAIAKIDKETKTRFKETFESVNSDLKELFPKVFGGGSAYLELTDSDLLEAGVTIMARPPGKKNSTIHLLSGGEKALTALSLVFSIFKLNPAPFCMLDEVDAPLDDVNVGRFCKLVEEMSDTVQFVYISHNKVAMEMAQQLAGVTMQEAGVSRLVAVDIEEANRLIDE